jgi:hypothetical protein
LTKHLRNIHSKDKIEEDEHKGQGDDMEEHKPKEEDEDERDYPPVSEA